MDSIIHTQQISGQHVNFLRHTSHRSELLPYKSITRISRRSGSCTSYVQRTTTDIAAIVPVARRGFLLANHQILKLLSSIGQRCSCWLNAIAAIHGITRPQTAPINNKRVTVADLAGPKPRAALVTKILRTHRYFSSELRNLHEKPMRTPRKLTKKPAPSQGGFFDTVGNL